MNNKYKTTAEVASELINSEVKKKVGHSLFNGTEAELVAMSNQAKSFLENPEAAIVEISRGMAIVSKAVVSFNILGNPRNYDYSFGKVFTDKDRENSLKILMEEIKELDEAMKDDNQTEMVDAFCDIMVVVLGLALKSGLLYETVMSYPFVCHNNLLKLKETEDGLFYADVKNGKIQKPEGFEGIKINKIFPYLSSGKEVNNG